MARDLTYTEVPGDPAVAVASDGGEFKWPELGIGLGIGVLLMIGLYLGTQGDAPSVARSLIGSVSTSRTEAASTGRPRVVR